MLKNLKQHRFFIQCLSILIAVLIVCSVFPINILNANAEKPEIWDGTKASSFAGGDGTEDSPFLIENANQLYKMLVEYHTYAASYGKYFKITKDIYLNDVVDGTSVKALTNKKNWLADYGDTIADASKTNSFNGNLDGGNNTIYGLYVDGIKSGGLFPAISSYAVIENLSFENVYITGGNGFGGAIAGQAIYYHYNSAAKITNCSVVNATIGESSNIEFVGGFIGDIKECSVYFTDCYAYNISLSDKATAGGIVGSAWSKGNLKLINCYSIGYFPTRSDNSKAVCTNVYTDTAAPTGNTTANVTVLTSEQMKGENAKLNMIGFDFERTWKTVEGGYPVHFVYVRPENVWDGTKDYNLEGTGSTTDPYLIKTAEQLAAIVTGNKNGAFTGKNFKLANDITINDTSSANWKSIALEWVWADFRFIGTFDGNGHTIDGLYYKGSQRVMGLFSYVGADNNGTYKTTIKNLNMTNAYIESTAADGAGFVAGQASRVAYFDGIYIDDTCEINSTVTGAGGILGKSAYNVFMSNIGMNGKVVGGSNVGAFVGTLSSGARLDIKSSYTSADLYAQGVIDRNLASASANIYVVKKQGTVDAVATQLSPEQMKGENAKLNMIGFDFECTWKTVEGGYPVHFVYVRPDNVWDGTKDYNLEGSGSSIDPYLIKTAEQLAAIVTGDNNGAFTGKYFKLANDITINDTSFANWKAYALDWVWANFRFIGTFDGNGHTIDGLYYKGSQRVMGLFSYVGADDKGIYTTTIKNLNMTNAYIESTAADGAGFVAGQASKVAYFNGIYIDDTCEINSTVKGAGGILGQSGYNVFMRNIAMNGKVVGSSNVGAFVGTLSSGAHLDIKLSYTSADLYAQGVTDRNLSSNSANIYVVKKQGTVDAVATQLSLQQMKGENAKLNMIGFDFGRTWKTVENSYPVIIVNPVNVWDGTRDYNLEGSGSSTDPYLIKTAAQLAAIVSSDNNGAFTGKYFKLANDIKINDTSSADWKDYALDWVWANFRFIGTFDGNGHTIDGLYYKGSQRVMGLFSYVGADNNGTYKTTFTNFNMTNAYIESTATDGVGFVAGQASKVAYFNGIYIDDTCEINSTVKGAGGILGQSAYNVFMSNIGMNGKVIGDSNVGAFVGTLSSGAKVELKSSYTSADLYAQGVTDRNLASASANIYVVKKQGTVDAVATQLSLEQMKGENAKRYMKGFNFLAIWSIVKDGYPVLNLDLDNIWDGTVAKDFAGGTGTAEDPYLIENGGQLYKMVSEYSDTPVNKKPESHTYFKITKDIYLDNNQWYTVNSTAYPNNENYKKGFSGIIYGEGHTIYGLYNDLASASVGLIPVATQGAEIYDLHLECGYFPKAEWNVYVGAAFIGSAIGVSNSKPIVIKGCSVRDFKVESRDASAAFIGYIYSQSVGIYNCYCVDSDISHTNTTDTKVNSSAFIAVTNGNDYLNSIIVANSYCVDVSPLIHLSGNFAAITKYSNIYTNYAEYDDSVSGIKKLTSEQMKGENAKVYMSGLDFGTFWKIVEDDYPIHSLYVKPDYVWDGSKANKFAGGTGTATDPYLIKTGAQLYKMVSEYSNASGSSGSVNKGSYFKLANDIYLNDVVSGDMENPSEASWSSKFNSWYKVTSYSKGFCGELDGDGYTVYGLYSNGGYSGLIPVLMDGGSVHNLNIKNSYIRGTESAGGIVGFVKAHWKMAPVSVSYCTVDNVAIESTKKFVGGIIGGFGDIKITVSDCSVTRSKLKSTNENPNLVSGIIGNGWGDSLVQNVTNCFTDSSVHPVTATTDKASFDTIATKVSYTNVYTSAKENFAVDGVTYLDSDSKLKGTSVEKVLKGFDFKNDWSATEDDYPVIKKGAGEWLYDNRRPGETWSGKLARYYASGEGTKEDPYVIKTGGQLALLANDALNGKTNNKYYKITENIILNDTSNTEWKKDANEWYTGKWAQAFRGNLDGGYHIISGLYLNKTKDNYTGTDYYGGLFACIGKNAVIEKLGIVNSSLTFTDAVSQKYLGAFAGFVDQYDSSANKASYKEYPIIRECFADTTVYLEANSCGGFIGCATRPIRVEDSFFTGKVASTSRGLFGYSKMGYEIEETLVKNFYTADSKYAVLSNASYDNIKCENCYSSSAQDKEGLTRLFIDRMLGKEAKKNMTGFDFKKVWSIRGDDETPGLKGFNAKGYSNIMSPEDIVVSFETNCDLMVESITGKAYSKLTLPELSREGYIFEGWYSFPELDVPFEYDYFPTFNTILYAKWTLSGFIQDFEQYEDSVYDYHEGYEYYRPSIPNYSADYVHGGGKSMHRLGDNNETLDFLLFYKEELEVGRTYKMSYYVTTDQENASVDMSLVHLDWPDVYCDNNGVDTLSTLDGIKDGEWKECTYTFVAKSKWIAIRTSGKDSVYFDDFILYTTNDTANVGAQVSNNFNSLWIVIAVSAAAVVILGAGATVFFIKKCAKK